jgi:hypothetical protein
MGGETKEAIWGRVIHQRLLGEYHKAVQKVWSEMISQVQVNELDAQMTQLGLSRSEASIIEKQITGETKEVLWERHRHQNALNEYRAIAIQAWEPNKMLTQALVNQLSADMTRLGLSQNEVAAIEREIMGKTKEELIVPSTPPSGSKLRWRWSPSKVKGKTKEELIVPSTPPNGSKLRWRWSPSKVIALILVVFFSLITIVFFGPSHSASFGFVTLILLVLCLIWFFRKPKLPVPNRPTSRQPNKPPTAQK